VTVYKQVLDKGFFAILMVILFYCLSPSIWPATIKGKVTSKPKKSIPRRVAQRYPGKHSQPPGKMEPVPAVILIMGKIKGFPPPKPAKPLKMIQEDFNFKPSLLVVPIGVEVSFPNADKEFHNVFSYSKIKRFDLGRYHQGESKSVRFTKPGIGKIYCEIHEWMRAAVVVIENPFYTIADKEGNYEIKDVPKGKFRLLVWKMDHKRGIKEIEIKGDETVELNFSLPETSPRNKTKR
jgi:hypothetical protein